MNLNIRVKQLQRHQENRTTKAVNQSPNEAAVAENFDDSSVVDKMTPRTSSPNPASHPSKMNKKNSEHLRETIGADKTLSTSRGIHDILEQKEKSLVLLLNTSKLKQEKIASKVYEEGGARKGNSIRLV